MAMKTVRRIASEILKVGESKIRFKPDSLKKIEEVLTREDVKGLIKEGIIYKASPRGVSRIRGRKKKSQLKKGRRWGRGSRRGTLRARSGGKKSWIAKVRAQRNYIKNLIRSGKIKDRKAYRKIYMMIKGNAFKSVKILDTYLKENKLLDNLEQK